MNPRVPKNLIALIRIFQNVDQTRFNLLTKRGNPNSFNLQSLKNLITTKNNKSLMLTKSLYFQMFIAINFSNITSLPLYFIYSKLMPHKLFYDYSKHLLTFIISHKSI